MINSLIIDDVRECRESLKDLIGGFCDDVRIVGTAGTISEGVQIVNNTDIDLVFLDINLGIETGFNFFKNFHKINFEVVFVSAYKEFALDAIKHSALDYILKPVDVSELKETVRKVKGKLEKNSISQIDEVLKQKLILVTTEGLDFVRIEDIIFCKANGFYSTFHIKGSKPILVCKNLKEYENVLPQHIFYRSHKSYIVNINEIKRYSRLNSGELIMSDGNNIPISKRKKEAFIKKVASLYSLAGVTG